MERLPQIQQGWLWFREVSDHIESFTWKSGRTKYPAKNASGSVSLHALCHVPRRGNFWRTLCHNPNGAIWDTSWMARLSCASPASANIHALVDASTQIWRPLAKVKLQYLIEIEIQLFDKTYLNRHLKCMLHDFFDQAKMPKRTSKKASKKRSTAPRATCHQASSASAEAWPLSLETTGDLTKHIVTWH